MADAWPDEYLAYSGLAAVEKYTWSAGGGEFVLNRRFFYDDAINRPVLIEADADGYGDAGYGDVDDAGDYAFIPVLDDRGTLMGVVTGKTVTVDGVGYSAGDLLERLYYNSTGLARAYDASGNLSGVNPYRSSYVDIGWCGMRRSRFTGLYHTHFRDYTAIHGRWLSEDPAGYADGLNLYHNYAGINGVDLLGLDDNEKVNEIRSLWGGANKALPVFGSDEYYKLGYLFSPESRFLPEVYDTPEYTKYSQDFIGGLGEALFSQTCKSYGRSVINWFISEDKQREHICDPEGQLLDYTPVTAFMNAFYARYAREGKVPVDGNKTLLVGYTDEEGDVQSISVKDYLKYRGYKGTFSIPSVQDFPAVVFESAAYLGGCHDIQAIGLIKVSRPSSDVYVIEEANVRWRWIDNIDANSLAELSRSHESDIGVILGEGILADLICDKLFDANYPVEVDFFDKSTEHRELFYQIITNSWFGPTRIFEVEPEVYNGRRKRK